MGAARPTPTRLSTPRPRTAIGTAARWLAVPALVALGMAVVPGATAQVEVPALPQPVPVAVDAKTTAYLVLDLTSIVCAPRPSCRATLPAAAALLAKARGAGALVVYSETPTAGSTILAEVAPAAGDLKVTTRADKFYGTTLDEILKSKGIKTCIIVGTAANGSVLYTAFGANLRGYTVVVAADGISADPFPLLYTQYQMLNAPGFANPKNLPLAEAKVTLSRSDLITFR
ncbi:MAG TPA: isochorismatase family protein [bacterium]|nr:isochorismatase family protein [bacterium]